MLWIGLWSLPMQRWWIIALLIKWLFLKDSSMTRYISSDGLHWKCRMWPHVYFRLFWGLWTSFKSKLVIKNIFFLKYLPSCQIYEHIFCNNVPLIDKCIGGWPRKSSARTWLSKKFQEVISFWFPFLFFFFLLFLCLFPICTILMYLKETLSTQAQSA